MFDKFGPGLRIPLILLFLITMYYLISGFFSSFDVTANVINIIQKNSSSTISYWLGVLFGIAIPFIVIGKQYNSFTSSNLSQLEKYNITSNSQGVPNSISDDKKNIDYTTLTLFILLIYGFVGVLFTIRKSSFNNFIYTGLVTIILLIIALLIYLLYSYIPYYNSANQDNMMKVSNPDLQIFIDTPLPNKNEDISTITSNQTQNGNTKMVYLITSIVIFVLSIVFFMTNNYIKSGNNDSGMSIFFKSLLSYR
jgi:hypothetical protein